MRRAVCGEVRSPDSPDWGEPGRVGLAEGARMAARASTTERSAGFVTVG